MEIKKNHKKNNSISKNCGEKIFCTKLYYRGVGQTVICNGWTDIQTDKVESNESIMFLKVTMIYNYSSQFHQPANPKEFADNGSLIRWLISSPCARVDAHFEKKISLFRVDYGVKMTSFTSRALLIFV